LAIQKIRRTFEKGVIKNWLNDDVFMHHMLYFLRCHGNPPLQLEAAWIFTNIAAGPYDQTKLVSQFFNDFCDQKN
jgi:hypothetical protein